MFYRLLKTVPTDELLIRFGRLLAKDLSSLPTQRAIQEFPRLFGSPNAAGTRMAVRAAGPLETAETLAASVVVLAEELVDGLRSL